MIFVLLLNAFLMTAAMINCGGKEKKGADFPQPQPTKPSPVAKADDAPKEAEKTAGNDGKKAEAGGDKKPAEDPNKDNKIADAIKKGDMLPANDNETLNDCESNWGAGVAGKQ